MSEELTIELIRRVREAAKTGGNIASFDFMAVAPQAVDFLLAKLDEMRAIAERLKDVCYGEGNRLANHLSLNHDSAGQWAIENLYKAANDANAALAQHHSTEGKQ